jgi:hypothetical protein
MRLPGFKYRYAVHQERLFLGTKTCGAYACRSPRHHYLPEARKRKVKQLPPTEKGAVKSFWLLKHHSASCLLNHYDPQPAATEAIIGKLPAIRRMRARLVFCLFCIEQAPILPSTLYSSSYIIQQGSLSFSKPHSATLA